MPSKVSITKSLLDELADTIALRADVSTYMSLSGMVSLVGSMYGQKPYNDLKESLLLKTYSASIVAISQATEIPDYAMAGLKSIQSISFPLAKKIGKFAFTECLGLSGISAPLVTEIGSNAFQNCSSITNVSFPSATKVRDYAFKNCRSLSQFSGSMVNSVGPYAFQNCTNLETPDFLLNPSGIDVGAYAFQSCSLISYATISKCCSAVDVRDEGGDYLITEYITADYAFQDCKTLTSASFTSTYNGSLPRGMFKGCSSLSSVESIPGGTIGSIGSFAFDGCVMLNPRTSTGYFPSFGEGTFRSCLIDYLSSPYGFETDGPKSVPSYAFQYCSQLSYINYRLMRMEKLEFIGENAFEGCSNLHSIDNMLLYVKSIYTSAFAGCSSLSSIGNVARLVTLSECAFADCVTLSKVPIGMLGNLSEIKRAAFSNCVNLSGAITVGSSCGRIWASAFYNCSKITSFYGSNVHNIGTGAFRNCINLSSVTLSTDLYAYGTGGIGDEAFKSCGILSINFGNLMSINSSTFENCLSLSSIVGVDSVKTISGCAFKSCKALTSVSFPNCKVVYYAAFQECTSLETVGLPSCSSIGNSAFRGCSKLMSLYLTLNSTVPIKMNNLTQTSPLNPFYDTPMLNSVNVDGSMVYGKIYVRPAMYSAMRSSSAWKIFINNGVLTSYTE